MVTRGFLAGVVGDDQVAEFVADVDKGVDGFMVECARLRLDGVAGCICICMSERWLAGATWCAARGREEESRV